MSEQYQIYEPVCVSNRTSFDNWSCPYLPRLCDYGLRARHISERYVSEDDDVKRALSVFDALIGSSQRTAEEGNPQIRSSAIFPTARREEQLDVLQFALYRLQQVGLVRDWFVDYEGAVHHGELSDPPVEVRMGQGWNLEAGLNYAAGELKKLVVSDQDRMHVQNEATLERLRASLTGAPRREQVGGLLSLLITYTFRTIKAMRYHMLASEWNYARAGETKTCRRQILRRVLDDQVVAEQSCGSCDVCCPDLKFTAKHLTPAPPDDDEALDELSLRLPTIFAAFNITAVDDALAIASEHSGVVSLQGHAEQRLVAEPTNLSALAIAGLCARSRELNDVALRHFLSGFLAVETGTRHMADAQYFYERVHELAEEQALDLLERKSGVFDSPEGRTFIFQEMQRAVDEGIAEESRLARHRVPQHAWAP